MAAVNNNSFSLKFASEQLKNNIKFLKRAIESNGLALGFAPEELKNNKTVVMAAVRSNGLALKHVSDELKEVTINNLEEYNINFNSESDKNIVKIKPYNFEILTNKEK